MSSSTQLPLFPQEDIGSVAGLDARRWHGSFNKLECSLQQLSPYVGKMKSGMAKVLVDLYSNKGDIVLDPFAGSGVVPLEAALAERRAWANDLSPYAYVLTKGKLDAPANKQIAVQNARELLEDIDRYASSVDLSTVPDWVRDFFHPKTLREVLIAFDILRDEGDSFLTACLLGILHHVRPGFLSYPASHLVPYLRTNKYPPEQYPKMYAYRDVRSRLLAKIERAYRRPYLPVTWDRKSVRVWQTNAMELPVADGQVDAIISSPPYFGALDYARDNRLRLWFLGCENWKELDASLTSDANSYLSQMAQCLVEMDRVLKPDGHCVLVLGDVQKNGTTKRTAEILGELAAEVTQNRFSTLTIYDDLIPDERRSRRNTKTTKFERILVMRKAR